MNRTEQEWVTLAEEKEALWKHGGNMDLPHAKLTSGNCSDGFINCSFLLQNPKLLKQACEDLIEACRRTDASIISDLKMVFGSAMGATDISLMMGLLLGVERGFTEKQLDGSMKVKRFSYAKGTRILLAEDVLSTGSTNLKSIQGIEDKGGIVLPWMPVICNRSGMADLDGRKIISLIEKEMSIWTPKECPLCEQGSEAILPKDRDNWSKLTAA